MLQWNKFLFVGILRRSVDAMTEEGILAADSSGKPRRRGKTTLFDDSSSSKASPRKRKRSLSVAEATEASSGSTEFPSRRPDHAMSVPLYL